MRRGVALNEHIAQELVKFYQIGDEWMKEFIAKCHKCPERFEGSIKKRKVKTFTGMNNNTYIDIILT